MSDLDYSSFCLEGSISPECRKRKKKHKKDKNCLKNPDVCQKRKKKNLILKESKEVSRRKKKNEKEPNLGISDGVGKRRRVRAEHRSKEPKLDSCTEKSAKKRKRKVKVEFDLPYRSTKHPIIPRPDAEEAAAGEAESSSLGQHHQELQSNSDELHSQDLFITQKIFRPSPPESSSGEAHVHGASPVLLPRDRDLLVLKAEDTRENVSEGKTFSLLSQHDVKSITKKCVRAEEDKQSQKTHTGRKMLPVSQRTLKSSFAKDRKRSEDVKNVHHSQPIVVDSSSDGPSLHTSASVHCLSPCSPQANSTPVASTGTQTENFFTTELSNYLGFCQKSKSTLSVEEVEPLDLSLPHRERVKQQGCFTPELTDRPLLQHADNKSNSCSWSSDRTHESEAVKASSGGAQTRLSTDFRFEAKCSDTTTSSEDNESSIRVSKLDLAQIRAVQMRLNESFYFKTKGEAQSPRPDSPLMKLAQGRKVKSRKKH